MPGLLFSDRFVHRVTGYWRLATGDCTMRAMLPRATAAAMLLLVVSGCTMWSEKQPATWNSATGPEAYERLL